MKALQELKEIARFSGLIFDALDKEVSNITERVFTLSGRISLVSVRLFRLSASAHPTIETSRPFREAQLIDKDFIRKDSVPSTIKYRYDLDDKIPNFGLFDEWILMSNPSTADGSIASDKNLETVHGPTPVNISCSEKYSNPGLFFR